MSWLFILFLLCGGIATQVFGATAPPVTTGLALWVDASQLTGADGVQVDSWTDMSGLNNHAVRQNGSSAGYPQLKTNVINGKAVVRFNSNAVNTGDYFRFTRIGNIQSVFWVLKQNAGTSGEFGCFFLGDEVTYQFHRGASNYLWHSTYTSVNIRNGITKLMGTPVNGTSTALPVDSFQVLSLVTSGGVVQANQICQDRVYNGSWQGDIAEILIYTTALSDAEEKSVGAFLAVKYGLTTTYAQPPTITSLSKTAGPLAGNQPLVITGTNLSGAVVTFGGTPAPVSNTTATTMTVTPPDHAVGAVVVAVTTAGGTASLPNAFTYVAAPTITPPLSVQRGPALGGTRLTITGTNLSNATVTFGGTLATDLVTTATSIALTTPAHAAGTVAVEVTTAGGTATSAYTYVDAPTISGLNPDVGGFLGGTSVVITGTNLSGASVTLGGTPADFVVAAATTVTMTTPAHAAGLVDVVVTTDGGTATRTGGFTYYVPAPSITSLNVAQGPAEGGTTVVIAGANLLNATVTFGGTPAHVLNSSVTAVTVATPAHATGLVDVIVTTAGGSDVAVQAFFFELPPPPLITGLTPIRGPAAGNATVTIEGGFMIGATVTFGGVPATIISNNSSTMTVATPAHAARPVAVEVTTAGGTAIWAGTYTYVNAPTITSLNVISGNSNGGTQVVITGTYLSEAEVKVTFGGAQATVLGSTATTLTVTTPPHAAGLVTVIATTDGGSAIRTGAFTYVVIGLPTFFFTDLVFTYDGAAKRPTITVQPAGMTYVVTYQVTGAVPTTTAPSAVGSYEVVATVTTPGYECSAKADMHINAGPGDDSDGKRACGIGSSLSLGLLFGLALLARLRFRTHAHVRLKKAE